MGSLFAGAFLGALPLAVGLLLGIYVTRRFGLFGAGGNLSAEQAERLIKQLKQWTSSMAGDVDECQRRMAAIGRDAEEAQQRAEPPAIFVKLMSQMVHANRHIQDKLAGAEDALAQQAQRIAGFLNEARTDALTGVPNRRMFDEELTRRHAESQRYGANLTLLMLDIDHFKRCNDAHGHIVGDDVLCRVAQAVGGTLRDSDLLARYGGEEFAVLLTSTSGPDSHAAAERARRAVEALTIDVDGEGIQVTISCGLAAPIKGESVRALLKRADEALYRSKSAGRNCGHWHDGERILPLTPRIDSRSKQANNDAAVATSTDDELHLACDALRERLLEVTAG